MSDDATRRMIAGRWAELGGELAAFAAWIVELETNDQIDQTTANAHYQILATMERHARTQGGRNNGRNRVERKPR